MSEYYGRDGKPIQQSEFFDKWSTLEYKRVAKDTVGDVEVSTVWLGRDHGWGNSEPVIFETMIFGGKYDQYQDRYTTEAEAVMGHGWIVEALRRGESPDPRDGEVDPVLEQEKIEDEWHESERQIHDGGA